MTVLAEVPRTVPGLPANRTPVALAGVAAVVLTGTAVALWWLLPADTAVDHWSLAWAGFDLGLAVLAVVTAVLLHRGDPRAVLALTAGAALLVCDAWFDVTTATTTSATWLAGVEAVLVELPLAALALRLAVRLLGRGP